MSDNQGTTRTGRDTTRKNDQNANNQKSSGKKTGKGNNSASTLQVKNANKSNHRSKSKEPKPNTKKMAGHERRSKSKSPKPSKGKKSHAFKKKGSAEEPQRNAYDEMMAWRNGDDPSQCPPSATHLVSNGKKHKK